MQKQLRLLILGIYSLSLFNFAAVPATTFAELSCDSIANSHIEGTMCICDPGYAAESGRCVPFTCDSHPNSHVEGLQCICDSYYKAVSGQCVPMSESEVCPKPNTHRDGDNCVCNEGYGAISGVCYTKSSICAKNHATYDASIDDCKCNAGYVMNATGDACNPVPKSTSTSSSDTSAPSDSSTTSPPIPNPTSLVPDNSVPNPTSLVPTPNSENPNDTSIVPTPGSEPSNTSSDTPPPPPVDPLLLLLQLNKSQDSKINVDDAIKAALKDATKQEADTAQKQQQSINNFVSSDDGEMSLPPTSDQKLNVIKGATIQVALNEEKNWNDQVKKAEANGDVKNAEDKKTYDDLKNKEQSLLTSYKQNQDALNNMGKQTFVIMAGQSLPSTPGGDYLFKLNPDGPQRNFIKEAQGDPNMALVYAAQATSAQMKLLNDIKDQMRQVKEQKQALLNVPPKPDTEGKLNAVGDKMGWQKNWYK